MLPEPTTRSPGSLKLVYGNTVQQHTCGARLVHDADLTDMSAMATEALAFANAVKACFPSGVKISSWRLTNPAGDVIFEEPFSPVISGTRATDAGDITSESTTHTLVGKGSGTIGLKAGNTRTVIYRFTWRSDTDQGARLNLTTGQEEDLVRTALQTSTVFGADFYGNKAFYKNYVDVQINAHWQKKFGL